MDIHLTEGGLELYGIQIEKSAEAIVVTGNEPIIVGVSQGSEGLNVNLPEIELGVISTLRIVFQ